MKTISSLFRRLAYGTDGAHPLIPNPSEVLHVHREDITGTIELRNLDTDDNPSKVLRVSWIKRDDVQGVMKTVWITDEIALY